jgi:hypothetical protein
MNRLTRSLSSAALAAALAVGAQAFIPVASANCSGTGGNSPCKDAPPAPPPTSAPCSGTGGNSPCRAELGWPTLGHLDWSTIVTVIRIVVP